MEGKTRFSRSKVPLYALEIWFLCIRSATHRYMRQPEQAGLHRDVSMYLYVAGRHSEM